MVEMGKEQRCAQLGRVRKKEKEDKGGMGSLEVAGGNGGNGEGKMGKLAWRGSRAEGQHLSLKSVAEYSTC
jgi:hypothetical protein